MMGTIYVSAAKLEVIAVLLQDTGRGIVDLSVAIEKLAEFTRDKVDDLAQKRELLDIVLACSDTLHIISISNAGMATSFLTLIAKAETG